MAPRKTRRRRNEDGDDDDDGESVGTSVADQSVGGGSDNDSDQGEDVEWLLKDIIERLEHKRAQIREAALTEFIQTLSSKVCSDALMMQQETCCDALRFCVRKGTATEMHRALKALGLLVVTIGTEAQALFTSIQPWCSKLAKDPGNDEVRCAAVRLVTGACFIGNDDDEATAEVLVLLEQLSLLNATPGPVKAASLEGLGLLLTLRPARELVGKVAPRLLSPLVKLLDHDSPETRMAAAENIAMLYEKRASLRDATDQAAEDALKTFGKSTGALQRLNELAAESDRHQNAEMRKRLRHHFKECADSVDTGASPNEVITIQREKLSFSSWAERKQLALLRSMTGSGFQVHFEGNELLRQIFGLPPPALSGSMHKMSVREKKQFLSKNSAASKDRTMQRSKQRSSRTDVWGDD